jgi:hypothetical protein
MKRLVLKKWVMVILAIINILAFIVMASEVDDLKLFVVSHLVACVIFTGNSMLIIKYGRKEIIGE